MTSVARNLLRSEIFGTHPYALRICRLAGVGRRVSTATIWWRSASVSSWRKTACWPCSATSGGEVREQVEALFAAMPAGELALASRRRSPTRSTNSRTVEKFEDKEQAVLMVGYPGTHIDSQDRHALELIDEASSDLGSRFFIRIREELGLAYFVGSSQMLGLAPGLFTFYVGTDPLKVDLVRAAFTEEIARLAANGSDRGGTHPREEEAPRQAGHRLPEQRQPGVHRRARRTLRPRLPQLQEDGGGTRKDYPGRSARGCPPVFP